MRTFLYFDEKALIEKSSNPAGNYMFKVNNRNTRTRCEICSKLIIKTPERRHCLLVPCSSVSIVNFDQVNAGWENSLELL